MVRILSTFLLFVGALQAASLSALAQLADWDDLLDANSLSYEKLNSDDSKGWYDQDTLTAREAPSLPLFDPSQGYRYQGFAGYGKSIQLNEIENLTPNDLDIASATLTDEDSQISRLGCSNLSYEESMRAALEVNQNDMGEYFNSNLSNYMVTTLFNSPSVADLFQGLQDFGSRRVQAMQDRCAAVEVKEDDSVMAMRAEALNRCVSRVLNDEGWSHSDAGELNAAYHICLMKPDSNDSIYVASQDKWAGTFFDGLKNTSFCAARTDEARDEEDCALMTFLHNVRWCTGTASDDRSCNGVDGVRLTQPSISPEMVFEAAMLTARAYLDHGYFTAKALSSGMSRWAGGDESGIEAAMQYSLGIYDTDYTQHRSPDMATVDTSDPDVPPLEREYKQHVVCDVDVGKAKAPSPSTGIWPTGSYVSNILEDSVDPNQYIVLTEDAETELKRLDDIDMSPDRIMDDIFDGISAQESVDDVYKAEHGLDLIGVAVACTMLHDMPVTLRDFLNMTQEGDAATPIRLGISQHIAQQVTENILSFMHHKLNLARLEMAYLPSTDPNAPAPHVKEAVNIAMDEVQTKLSAMKNFKNNRSSFAKAMGNIKTN